MSFNIYLNRKPLSVVLLVAKRFIRALPRPVALRRGTRTSTLAPSTPTLKVIQASGCDRCGLFNIFNFTNYLSFSSSRRCEVKHQNPSLLTGAFFCQIRRYFKTNSHIRLKPPVLLTLLRNPLCSHMNHR